MPFVLKPSFNYEAFEQVIKSYKFPITDLETAVKFLNELPKECNVDLRESITYCNLHSVQAIDGKFNMLFQFEHIDLWNSSEFNLPNLKKV